MINYQNKPKKVNRIKCIYENRPDAVFICCSSFEERCLGSLRNFSDYRANRVFLFSYLTESRKRDKNLEEMRNRLAEVGEVKEISTHEDNPLPSIQQLIGEIKKYISHHENQAITLDISTFTKRHLLLMLKALNLNKLLDYTRLLYTEPRDYVIKLEHPLSFGLKGISVIPTFTGQYDPSKELLLVIFLGYEGDRAMAMLENLDPHKCILVIPRPSYYRKWEGRTEEMNVTILHALGEKAKRYVHSRDPNRVVQQLEEILSEPELSIERYNHSIAPLGTKPQTVGIYLYTLLHPDKVTLIYAAPLRHNQPFYSTGIGPSWVLPLGLETKIE